MYKSILVPTDGSMLSAKAVREAAMLAKAIGAKVTVIHVMPSYEQYANARYYDELPALAAPVEKRYKEEFTASSK